MAKPFYDRLAAMMKRTAPVRGADVAALLDEAEQKLLQTNEAAAEARKTSVDPMTPQGEAQAAYQAAKDLDFAAERLTAAIAALRERHSKILNSDQAKASRAEYDAAAAENAALAVEIAETYPAVLAKLCDLFARLAANDTRIANANRSKPADCPALLSAESVARGYEPHGSWPYAKGAGPVWRLLDMKLPNADRAGEAWPPSEMALAERQAAFEGQARHYREQEEARRVSKRRYSVQRTDSKHGQLTLRHADGFFRLGMQKFVCDLHGDEFEKAEADGMTIEPVPADTPLGNVGGPGLQ